MTHDELTALVQTLVAKVETMDRDLTEAYSMISDLQVEAEGLRERLVEVTGEDVAEAA